MSDPIRTASAPLALLMATYNGERFLEEQIQSIQGQDFEDWGLFVSDDGSQDATQAIVERFAQEDHRIHGIPEPTEAHGAKENFAHLLQSVGADYYAFADQDDVWEPRKLSTLMARMHEVEAELGTSEPALVFSDAALVDERLEPLGPSFIESLGVDPEDTSLRALLSNNMAPGCTMLINRPLAALARDAVADPRTRMHDWLLMLVARSAGTIAYVPEPLVRYRQHGDNTLGAHEKTVGEILRSKFSTAGNPLHAKVFDDSVAQARLLQETLPRPPRDPADAQSLADYVAFRPRRPLTNLRLLSHSGVHDRGARAWVMRYGAATYGFFSDPSTEGRQ